MPTKSRDEDIGGIIDSTDDDGFANSADRAVFDQASDLVIAVLRRHLAFDYWILARVDGIRWTLLKTAGESPFAPGAIEARLPALCAELSHDSQTESNRHEGPVDYVGAHVVVGGEIRGLLCGFGARAPWHQDDACADLIALSARMLGSVLDRQRTGAELRQRMEVAEVEALVDDLTGLRNRRGWNRSLDREASRVERYGGQAAIFVMDVDGLKAMNDRNGHAAGDEVLRAVAGAIRRVTREHDIVARLGGDEFAILAVETSVVDASALRERLQRSFKKARLSVSIGQVHCKDRDDIVRAVERADVLLYVDKRRRSRSVLHVVDASSGATPAASRLLEPARLRHRPKTPEHSTQETPE